MGFRKTPKGTLIYDFDFVPKKLIPLTTREAGFPYGYAVEGENGRRAPFVFDFQGQRYPTYGFVFCFIPNERGGETCITTNIQLVATLASLYMRSGKDENFDPWGTNTLARKGITFPIMRLDEAEKFIKEQGIPRDGYAFLSQQTS